MYLEKVQLVGDIKSIWQNLLTTLQANRYEVNQEIPYSQIIATRGNRLSNFLLSTPRHGFRELDITLFPSGRGNNEIEITFSFNFPALSITWSPIKKDCHAMIDQFVKRAKGAPSQVGLAGGDVMSCDKCGAANPSGASFCRDCGGKLERPSPEMTAASESLICEKCQATNPLGSSFCNGCGTKLQTRITKPASSSQELICQNCRSALPPGAQFCSMCGCKI